MEINILYWILGGIPLFFFLLYIGAMFAINRRIKQNQVKETEDLV